MGTVLFYQRIQGAEVERVEVIELFPPPPAELAFFMVRVVSSDRKGRIGVETQVTINSKQARLRFRGQPCFLFVSSPLWSVVCCCLLVVVAT